VIEKGRDVEYLDIGDLVSVPFNVRAVAVGHVGKAIAAAAEGGVSASAEELFVRNAKAGF